MIPDAARDVFRLAAIPAPRWPTATTAGGRLVALEDRQFPLLFLSLTRGSRKGGPPTSAAPG